jgi:H+/Cl- antiporter ClcA
MRKKVLESSILFVSIVKWLSLASIAGITVGVSTAVFLKALEGGITFAMGFSYYYLLLPAAMALSVMIVKYFAPQAEGHGTEKIIEAVHRHSGKINLPVIPVKLIATVITISLGGSAGKEGPAAQIGAGLCSALSSLFRFDDRDRKKMVICGISAGFAAVFGTPIAGAIFGVEVLFVGAMFYDVLLPSFVAGIVGYQVSSALGITYFHEPLNFVPVFSSALFIKVCVGGLFFGLCSLVFIEMLRFFENVSGRIKLNKIYKAIIGGSVLIALSLVFSTNYFGLGLDTIKNAVEGESVNSGAFILKMLFTSITLSFGGSGGIITPIFFVGATAGNTFGSMFGLDASLFAAIGMVGLLAGAANTPISASIMAVELFGPQIGSYAAVACIISFLMTGHRSVYPSQVLALAKSSSIIVSKGQEMKGISGVEFNVRTKSITGGISKGIKKIMKNKRL